MVENKVKSVKKTFEIVNTIQELDGASLTTLAREMGMPQSTAHNYLKSLEESEYLVNDDGSTKSGFGSSNTGPTPVIVGKYTTRLAPK